MGTSKAYGTPKWPGVNSAVGEAVSSGGQKEDLLTAVGKFSNAYKNQLGIGSGLVESGIRDRLGRGLPGGGPRHSGGGRGTAGGVSRARSATSGARLANFINTAQRSGFNEALRQFNITHLKDKPLEEFLDSLNDILAGDGGFLDDDALNRAMAVTIDDLTEDIESIDELEELLSGGSIDIESTLQVYYANLLAENFEQKEYSYVREKKSRAETKSFFKQARDLIQAIIRDELSQEKDLSSIDWNSVDGQHLADEINQEVLEILIP